MTEITITLRYATHLDAIHGLGLIEESLDLALEGCGLEIFEGVISSETGNVQDLPEFCECGRYPQDCLTLEGGSIHGDI